MSRFVIALFAVITISGCNVGPRHCVPEVSIAEGWHASTEDMTSHCSPLPLWELFDDPLLAHYLQRIAFENLDVKLAYAKVCEAYALRQISFSRLFPFIDSRVAYNSAKPAGGILEPQGTPGQDILGGIPLNIKQQTFLADFDALWEIDLFGRTKRQIASATAFIAMQQAEACDAILSLTAEFARIYLELRRAQNNLELTEDEIAVLTLKGKDIQERLEFGLDSVIPLLEIQTALAQLRAEVPFLEGEILHSMYRLGVLLGKNPETLVQELDCNGDIPQMKSTIPLGFPSDLLRRRPDIRFAERQIAKATAELGVSVADLFPKLTLMGNYGFQNLHLGMTKGEGESWSYGGNLLTPFFHGGSLLANVKRYRWIRKETMIEYEQTVLSALSESESAIARFFKSKESLHEQEKSFQHSCRLLHQTEERLCHGLANTFQLLDQKLRTIQAERNLINQMIDSEIQLVALYKALGGSW